jgi:hypothetical protein
MDGNDYEGNHAEDKAVIREKVKGFLTKQASIGGRDDSHAG